MYKSSQKKERIVMTKSEIREMIKVLCVGVPVKKCKTPKYKNITWPLERHPWGIYSRGRQAAQMKSAAGPNVQYC
jgi:hypothetical protein